MLNIFIVKPIEFQSLKCQFCNQFLFLNGVLIVRKDFVKPDGTCIIIKPDTPSGHKSAQKREQLMHRNGIRTETIFYDPKDKRYLENSPTYIGQKNNK